MVHKDPYTLTHTWLNAYIHSWLEHFAIIFCSTGTHSKVVSVCDWNVSFILEVHKFYAISLSGDMKKACFVEQMPPKDGYGCLCTGYLCTCALTFFTVLAAEDKEKCTVEDMLYKAHFLYGKKSGSHIGYNTKGKNHSTSCILQAAYLYTNHESSYGLMKIKILFWITEMVEWSTQSFIYFQIWDTLSLVLGWIQTRNLLIFGQTPKPSCLGVPQEDSWSPKLLI